MTPAVDGPVSVRLDQLRTEFDRSFAEPVSSHDAEHAELLLIRAGGRPYALRLSQTSGVHPDRPITPLPGPLPALLGLVGFAGSVVPVYDLTTLLGHPAGDRPRWLVLAAGSPRLGLAFHELDGHVRVPAGAIIGEAAGTGHRGGLGGLVELPGGARPIVDVPAMATDVHDLEGLREIGRRLAS